MWKGQGWTSTALLLATCVLFPETHILLLSAVLLWQVGSCRDGACPVQADGIISHSWKSWHSMLHFYQEHVCLLWRLSYVVQMRARMYGRALVFSQISSARRMGSSWWARTIPYDGDEPISLEARGCTGQSSVHKEGGMVGGQHSTESATEWTRVWREYLTDICSLHKWGICVLKKEHYIFSLFFSKNTHYCRSLMMLCRELFSIFCFVFLCLAIIFKTVLCKY